MSETPDAYTRDAIIAVAASKPSSEVMAEFRLTREQFDEVLKIEGLACPLSPANDHECQREPRVHQGQHENYDARKRWMAGGSRKPWYPSERWFDITFRPGSI